MKALILAAGYATRLYPLTKEYPKPLLLVRNRPIINYIIDKLDKLDDVDEIIVVTNSKFVPFFRKWAKGKDTKKRISLVDDLTRTHSDKRGAIGDINFTLKNKRIKDDLLVIGGDNLFNGDLEDFLEFAKGLRARPVVGVYDLDSKKEASKYGIVKVDKNNRIVNFQEKPKDPQSTLVAMCLYYFPKNTLRFVKEYFRKNLHKADATGFYIGWLRKKISVYAFSFGGSWYDIGDHNFYNKAKKQFRKKEED